VKRFYSIKLKYYKEKVQPYTAKLVLTKESPLINYLSENRALKWVYRKNRNLLEAYGEEKHLMVGKIKYPEMFGNKLGVSFMDLYISHIINKQIMLSKGSS
jgi:hypothetical protein